MATLQINHKNICYREDCVSNTYPEGFLARKTFRCTKTEEECNECFRADRMTHYEPRDEA